MQGNDVKFIDALNLRLNEDELIRRLNDCDIVGIGVLTDYYLEAKSIVKKLKKLGKIIILGGVHPTVLPIETLKETGADFIVLGEGEEVMGELITSLKNKTSFEKIRGIAYRKNNKIYVNPRRDLIKNLDNLPFPDWDSMDPREYQKAPHGAIVKNFPVAPIITTRGCPYECKFCVSPNFWLRKIRFRSPEKVIEEIEYLIKNFGVKEIHFEDDNLTLRREHVEKICRLILAKNIKISWATPNGIRADKVDETLLRLMKKSGCYSIVLGIESGNEGILKNIKKRESLTDIEKAAKAAKKAGLITQGFFILGLPGETEETIKKSINFAKKIKLDRAHFMLLDLLPGSELWKEHKHEFTIDFSKRSYQDVTWVPPTINPGKLKKWQPRAFRQFFFRPRPLFSVIKYIKLSQIKHIFNRLKDYRIIKS
jgi:radical SAM superfamily enzyme YgiQ (UPF0313 family)